MLKKLTATIPWTAWQLEDERYRRLEIRDRFLDGTAYDHLPFDYATEEDNGKYVSIHRRRPAVIYPLPALISRLCSRKLFSGRFAPRLVHKNEKLRLALQKLVEEADLENLMMQVVHWGSVGSVMVSYKVVADGVKNDSGKVVCEIWRSKYCTPKFDKRGNLKAVRIAYVAGGYEFLAKGYSKDVDGKDIIAQTNYWRVIDMTDMGEQDYKPVLEGYWKPSKGDEGLVKEDFVEHKLGFCQAHWFVNATAGTPPDGACTFGPILPLAIELDYTLSQLGRAVRYNASPQIVTIGELQDFDDDRGSSRVRSPHVMLMFSAATKEFDQSTTGGGDAKLLEMHGEGISVGLAYVERLRKMAMESVAAVRKDPDNAGSLITGKAMEALDEDFIGLLQELRTAFGTRGFLPLLKQLAIAAKKANHPIMRPFELEELDELTLQWPMIHLPTPAEMQQLVNAMVQAMGTPDTPATATSPAVKGSPQLIDPKDAKEYLYNVFDFPLYSYNRIEEPQDDGDGDNTSVETKKDESRVIANEPPAA